MSRVVVWTTDGQGVVRYTRFIFSAQGRRHFDCRKQCQTRWLYCFVFLFQLSLSVNGVATVKVRQMQQPEKTARTRTQLEGIPIPPSAKSQTLGQKPVYFKSRVLHPTGESLLIWFSWAFMAGCRSCRQPPKEGSLHIPYQKSGYSSQ